MTQTKKQAPIIPLTWVSVAVASDVHKLLKKKAHKEERAVKTIVNRILREALIPTKGK